ncbi:MAG: DUF2089 domain-containing protein [Acidimicrobiales bacterium]
MSEHRHAPRTCPVCGDELAVTRLACRCGTELSGSFAACEFCALGAADLALLRVFLASRGNLKEVERHLGVSYPTARARVDSLLGRLGLASPGAPLAGRLDALEALAAGDIDVDEALGRI